MFACRTSLRTVVLNSYFGIFCFLRFLVVLEAIFFLKNGFCTWYLMIFPNYGRWRWKESIRRRDRFCGEIETPKVPDW